MPELGPDAPAPLVDAHEEPTPAVELRITITPPSDDVDLDDKLATLPARPGVYLLRTRTARSSTSARRRACAAACAPTSAAATSARRCAFLMQRVADFETLVTRNEKEALILENNLIKQYKPRYNIRLKDDKSYVSVKVDGARRVAARAGDAQDRRGRQQVLRPVLLGVQRARDARHDPQGHPAAHLQRHASSATARGRASSTRSSAASARAACRSIAASTRASARAVDAARGQEPAARAPARRAHAAPRPRRCASRTRRGCATDCAPSRRRRSASRRWRTGATTRTSSASTARAASSRRRCCSCARASSPATRPTASRTSSCPTRRSSAPLLTQFYQGERYVPDEVLLPIELEDADGARRVPQRAQGPARRDPPAAARRQACGCSRWRARTRAQSFRERQDAERAARAHERGAAAQAAPAQRAEAHRVLRHLELPGRPGGRLDGDLRRRRAGQERATAAIRIKTVAGSRRLRA